MGLAENHRYAIIIGAMKAGTTSLFAALAKHPQVAPCNYKEPEFFSANQKHRVDARTYEDLWTGATNEQIRLEASTGYTKYPMELNVPRKIRAYGIAPKFIYVVRDPIARFESHVNFMRSRRKWELNANWRHLRYVSSYFTQLERFCDIFGRESILVVSFEDFVRDSGAVYAQCCRFLEIDKLDNIPHFDRYNETKRISRVERTLKNTPFGLLGKFVTASQKKVLRDVFSRVSTDTKFSLSENERKTLKSELSDDMCQLRNVYGVDTNRWGF